MWGTENVNGVSQNSGEPFPHNIASEWQSKFDFDAMKAATEQVKVGRSLKQALDEAEKNIYLP